MKVKITAFGIAREIIGKHVTEMEIQEGITIGGLKSQLIELYPQFSELRSLKLAVNEDYREDTFPVSVNDDIVIIPPVSGG